MKVYIYDWHFGTGKLKLQQSIAYKTNFTTYNPVQLKIVISPENCLLLTHLGLSFFVWEMHIIITPALKERYNN